MPVLRKTTWLVPVPKKAHPSSPFDYRKVALTLHCMKVLERLVHKILCPMVRPALDPLQFANQAKVGVDDAIIYLLHCVQPSRQAWRDSKDYVLKFLLSFQHRSANPTGE